MKKLLLFAAVAGLGLVSASPPPKGPDNGPGEPRHHYPPCSRAVRDSCIQLYERGVSARHHRDDEDYMRDAPRGRPDDYAQDDHRWCPEHRARHGDHHGRAIAERRTAHRMAMTARAARGVGCRCAQPPRRQVAQRVRRAGERG